MANEDFSGPGFSIAEIGLRWGALFIDMKTLQMIYALCIRVGMMMNSAITGATVSAAAKCCFLLLVFYFTSLYFCSVKTLTWAHLKVIIKTYNSAMAGACINFFLRS